MKTVVINRAKWAIPRQTEEAMLLNEYDGTRCCLGFLGKSCGVSDDDMRGETMLTEEHEPIPVSLFRRGSFGANLDPCNQWRHALAAINDEENIDDATREAWVREGFKRILKRRVRFVGKYAVKEPKR